MAANREQFGSRLGFILAAAGSAVGIGNIVGFPVAATKNGGGAFLLIYALMVILICLPIMMAEFAVGRTTKKDPLGAFEQLSGNSRGWSIAGFLCLLTPFMISVFYTVITVWLFGYLYNAVIGNLDKLARPEYFGEFINDGSIFIHMVAVACIVIVILMCGVQKGIERAAKILMPALLTMLVGLMIFVLTLDGAFAGVKYFLIPDVAKIDAGVISAALSQAFFSLSLGMGTLITYGSYMSRKTNLPDSAKLVALADTSVAFIAGLLIIPAIFSFNPNTDTDKLSDSSVSLIFNFLPKIFLALETTIGYIGASIVATIFFLLVFFAAITSLVSLVEVPVSGLMGKKNYSRRKSLITLITIIISLSLICATSFGMLEFFTKFLHYAGADKSFFDLIVDIFYDTILPLNGFMVCMLVIYRWKKHNFNVEMEHADAPYHGTLLERYVDISLGTIIPFILAAIFINTVSIKFFGTNILF